MQLEHTKRTVAIGWIMAAFLLGLALNVRSTTGWGLLAAVALGPPLIMMLLWKAPAQTTSESIQNARR